MVLTRYHQPGDGPRVFAVVQQDWRGCARLGCCIDKGVGPASRREHDRAVAGEEGLRRLAIQSHDLGLHPLDFDRNHMALAGIDETKPQPFVRAHCNIGRNQPVYGVDQSRIYWVRDWADRGSVRAEPKILDQKGLIAIDSLGLAFLDEQGQSARGWTSALSEEAKVDEQRAGVAKRSLEAGPGSR